MNKKTTDSINSKMIAPCGMNCGLCIGFLRERNPCSGCHGDDANKPHHCVVCAIKNCEEMKDSELKFCFVCSKSPCLRMRKLDKRYRAKYGMSMIENLEFIREQGLESFIEREKKRWKCPGCDGIISVHRDQCLYCGREKAAIMGISDGQK